MAQFPGKPLTTHCIALCDWPIIAKGMDVQMQTMHVIQVFMWHSAENKENMGSKWDLLVKQGPQAFCVMYMSYPEGKFVN